MPIALLLNTIVAPLQREFALLRPWATLALQEELILDRARGAFLTAWFGRGLPLSGGGIQIAIDNMRALIVRYNEVLAQSREIAGSGRNLTEPLAGVAGGLIGAVLSPPVAFALGVGLHTLPGWVRALMIAYAVLALGLPVLLGLVGYGPVSLAILGGVTGAGALAGIVAGVQHQQVILLLGTLADLFAAVTEFLRQLTGLREGVRNPLVRQALGLLDALARLVPFVLAFVAVVFTRIVPYLAGLAQQLPVWARLLATYVNTLEALLVDFRSELLRPFRAGGLILGLPERILRALTDALARMFDPLIDFLAAATALVTSRVELVRHEVESYIARTVAFLLRLFRPVLELFAVGSELRSVLGAVGSRYFPSTPGGGSGGSSPLPSYPSWLRYVPTAPPPPPPFPSLPAAPPGPLTIGPGVVGPLGTVLTFFQAPLALSPEAQAAIDAIRRPRSIFGAEWARLARQRQAARGPETLLIYEQERPLRDLIVGLIQRNLPGAVRPYLPRLTGVFRGIDRLIEDQPERVLPVGPFPVVTPEEPILRPDVGRLRIRIRLAAEPGAAAGASPPPAVRIWAESLRRALVGQPYPVPEGDTAPAGAGG
jgi:hypothetical protein